MTRHVLVVFLVTAALSHVEARAQQPAPRDVLARFAGTWNLSQDSVAGEREEFAALIMGDRFVDSRTWLPSNGFSRINTQMLMTYDETLKSYRACISWSNGENWEAKGEWDAESQTMTWTAPTRKGSRVFRSIFSGDSKREWSIEDFDADGRTGWSTKGVARRDNEQSP